MYEAVQVVPASTNLAEGDTQGTGPGVPGTVVFLVVLGLVILSAAALYFRNRGRR